MLFRRLGLALASFPVGLTLPAFCVDEGDFACVGAKVYPSPTDPPIENATLLVHDGKIIAVAPSYRLKNKFPHSAVTIDCKGKVIVAGFWNSHVHFTTGWDDVPNAPVAALTSHMQQMLTRWGFTTVWDLGSDPNNTLALRQRIESGEVSGTAHPDGRRHLPQGRSSCVSPAGDATAGSGHSATGDRHGEAVSADGPRRHQAFHRRLHGRRSRRSICRPTS